MSTKAALAKKAAPSRKAGRPARKTPGRPANADPELRAKLLDAAAICFARVGVANATLRAIAEEAGATPALLHYYFGGKPELLDVLVDERLAPAFAPLGESLQRADEDVSALVAAFVVGMGVMIAKHPWLPSLWVREVLCEGGALREAFFRKLGPKMPELAAARFTQAQSAGRLREGLDPRLLVVSLVGLTLFPAAAAPVWRRLFKADDVDADVLLQHTITLLDGGIED